MGPRLLHSGGGERRRSPPPRVAIGTLVRNLGSSQPTAAELFDLLWENLAELLGTAATATLVRRATKRLAAEAPAPPMVSVTRNTVTYQYEVPESWRRAADPDALRVLRAFAKELGVLLTRLTGSVVVERLEREPRFRESGVSFVEASKRG